VVRPPANTAGKIEPYFGIFVLEGKLFVFESSDVNPKSLAFRAGERGALLCLVMGVIHRITYLLVGPVRAAAREDR
jgi:hypothetical protein